MRPSVIEILEIARLRGFILEEVEEKEESIEDLFRRVFGDGIEVLPPDTKPKTCYACGGTLFWISKYNGHLYCAICHPPADPEAVAGWRGEETRREKAPKREEINQINYQKPICMWCKAGKSLNCPDCKGGEDEKSSIEA